MGERVSGYMGNYPDVGIDRQVSSNYRVVMTDRRPP